MWFSVGTTDGMSAADGRVLTPDVKGMSVPRWMMRLKVEMGEYRERSNVRVECLASTGLQG